MVMHINISEFSDIIREIQRIFDFYNRLFSDNNLDTKVRAILIEMEKLRNELDQKYLELSIENRNDPEKLRKLDKGYVLASGYLDNIIGTMDKGLNGGYLDRLTLYAILNTARLNIENLYTIYI